jgi:hypothetical protein
MTTVTRSEDERTAHGRRELHAAGGVVHAYVNSLSEDARTMGPPPLRIGSNADFANDHPRLGASRRIGTVDAAAVDRHGDSDACAPLVAAISSTSLRPSNAHTWRRLYPYYAGHGSRGLS